MTIVPPIKCQGIKTKLVPVILELVPRQIEGKWIEPFCGSGVVALNAHPQRALLADTNQYIIALYRAIQGGDITPGKVRAFLEEEGKKLSVHGTEHYMEVRARFNAIGNPLDLLFLSRSCFNGVMRFNGKGKFNVPFCHKPDQFSQAYVTKITNQVRAFADVLEGRDWQFMVQDFSETLSSVRSGDFAYVDPPYAGRHVDYYNSWKPADEERLIATLQALPCQFLLSTWHSNQYRTNPLVGAHWQNTSCHMETREHFYHVGPTEELRNPMLEALIYNYDIPGRDVSAKRQPVTLQQAALF